MNFISSSRTLLVAAMAAPLLLGCGAESLLEADVPGLPADFEGPGTYTVPGFPKVQFAIKRVHVEQENGTVSVYYDLPAAFSAQASKVELSGAADGTETVKLEGTAGASTCTVLAGLLECHEQLSGVRFNPSWLPPSDPQSAAVESFLVDPIGILSAALPL